MAEKKTALFVGRFQPFHLGHLSVCLAALKKFDFLVIAIGSSNKSRTPENPFTVGERHTMAKDSLTAEGYKAETDFKVVPLPDIDDNEKWPKHLIDACPKFDVVISGNPLVKELFEKKTKKEVIVPKEKYKISATDVREALTKGQDLQKYLHPAVIAFLQKIGAARKIVEIDELAAAAEAEAAE